MPRSYASLAAAAALAALPVPVPAAAPTPERFEAGYALSFLGLGVGTATLKADRLGDRYALNVEAGLKGLAGVFFGGDGAASSKGRIATGRVVPEEFRLQARYSGQPLRVTVHLDAGTVRSASVEPAVQPKPDRVPVPERDKAGVVDPVGMLAVPVPAGPLDPSLCDRRVPVYDGASRADLVLSRGAAVSVAEGPYRGPALDCRVRWVPVSGHRAGRPAVRRMADNDEMSVRLAPVPGGGLLLPLAISVATGWGTARIDAVTWGAPRESAARTR